MASANTLCKQLLGVKSAVVTGHDFYQDSNGVNHLRIHARPDKRHEDDCPFCHKRCRPYDVQTRLPRTQGCFTKQLTVLTIFQEGRHASALLPHVSYIIRISFKLL